MSTGSQADEDIYVQFIDQQPHTYGESEIGNSNSLNLEVASQIDDGSGYSSYHTTNLMGLTYALASVDQLIAHSIHHNDINVEFSGTEPLLNRQLIRQVTEYTLKQAKQKHLWVNFAVTTNANFLTSSDAQFFVKHKFEVTVNINGPKTTNDKKNATTKDKNQYYNALRGVGYLRSHRPAKLNAQVNVTPLTPGLLPLLQHMIALGFEKIEFIPQLNTLEHESEYSTKQLDRFMIEIAECSSYAKNYLPPEKRFSFRDFDALPQKKAALVGTDNLF